MAGAVPRVEIEMLPASCGDSFLVRCIGPDRSTNILVDAGVGITYDTSLRQRLLSLRESGEDLAALVVTHIDADHIEGAISFISENGDAAEPAIIRVRDVWHNSYRHLAMPGRAPTSAEAESVLSQIPAPASHAPGDISSRQGSTLAALLRSRGYSWNAAFGGGPVVSSQVASPVVELDQAVRLTILSPLPSHLTVLAREWRRELLALGVPHEAVDFPAFETAFETLLLRPFDGIDDDDETPISSTDLKEAPPAASFREDRSITNASSIAFLLEFGGARALFLGDALPSVLSDQLATLKNVPLPLEVGAVKVSHHGSKRNTSPSLLSKLASPHFLISTDGQKHGHPDLETLLWIAASQPGSTMHFNYGTASSAAISQPDIKHRYGHLVEVVESPSIATLVLPSSTRA